MRPKIVEINKASAGRKPNDGCGQFLEWLSAGTGDDARLDSNYKQLPRGPNQFDFLLSYVARAIGCGGADDERSVEWAW